MAFRGYELNLILRVQDRATTRLRRLSQDIGGLSRASDLQRQSARIAQTRSRNMVQLSKAQAALESRTAQMGTKNLQTQAQLSRAVAQRITLEDRLGRIRNKSSAAYAATQFRLAAANADILRIQESQVLEQAALNQEIAGSIALERALASEAAIVAAEQAKAQRIANMQRRARLVTHAGSVAAMAGGIGVIAAAGTASKFAEFNRQAVGAATQMRGINESFASTIGISKTLQTALVDLTKQFPATAEEMSQAIYDIASGMDFQISRTSRLTETQQRFNQSMRLLRYANQVAIAGNVDLKTATDSLIFTFNNFDPAIRHPIRILNDLFAIVRFGKGTFAEFAPEIGRLASAANAAGQSFTEAGSALAFLSQRMPLTRATTALVRIFQIIGRKEFTTGFQELFKVSPFIEGTRRLRNLSELMYVIEKQGPKIWKGFTKGSVDLMNVLQNITAAGQNAMKGTTDAVGLQSTEFARRAVTNLVVFGTQYRSVLQDVSGTQGEFIKSLQAFRNQPGVQWQIAINQFKAFAIVVGQEVLPVMLRFFDFIGRIVRRFQELNPHTRRLIGEFAAWGSITLLVAGAITTMVGGLGILITRLGGVLKVLGLGGAAGVTGRMAMLLSTIRRIAAVGVIAIVLKAVWKGEPSARDYLLAALGGGVAGSRLGPVGAVAGATIAVGAAAVAGNRNFRDVVADKVLEKTAKQGTKARAYGVYLARNVRLGINNYMTRQQFDEFTNKFKASDAVERNRSQLHNLRNQVDNTAQSILQRWRDLANELTGVDLFGGSTQQAAQAAANIGLNLAKAEASGNQAKIRGALKAQIDWYMKEIGRMQKLPMTPERIKNLTEAWQAVGAAKAQLEGMDKKNAAAQTKATHEAERHRKAVERANRAYETASRRVDQVKQKIKQLREQEVDKLRSVFGDIFGGPLMQGPLGQAFSNIASTLSGFGQTFPIPAQMILNDQKAQQKQFDLLISDLNLFQKRGLQPKAVQNILSQGPSALPFLEGIRRGGAGSINQFIKNVNTRNKSILDAMQTPFEKQIVASDNQLKAARMQLKAAQERLQTTKTGKATAAKTGASKTATKPTPTRTTQSHTTINYHGDKVEITASGATANAVKSALDRHSFDKRHRR